MIYHDVEQNTDEWLALRAGKITSSKIACIMANYGKAFGDPAKKYAAQIAIEQITGNPISSLYTNEHMDRGHEQEPIARQLYEQRFFTKVQNGGFFEMENQGTSPDGLVFTDGQIEIKSVIASTHYATIVRQSFDTAYKWQMIHSLKTTNREWIDFVSYCSDFPKEKNLYTFRIYAGEVSPEFEMIDDRVREFEILIEKVKQSILNCEYTIY